MLIRTGGPKGPRDLTAGRRGASQTHALRLTGASPMRLSGWQVLGQQGVEKPISEAETGKEPVLQPDV